MKQFRKVEFLVTLGYDIDELILLTVKELDKIYFLEIKTQNQLLPPEMLEVA
jgi:hypothetical protein